MKNRKISPILLLGSALILFSLSFLAFFLVRNHMGVRESEKILEKMEQILPETTPGIPGTQLDTAMPVLQIQGKDYVAMIDVPAYGITLPVADVWDTNRLHVTPSRYFGSAYNGTLVIGGSDHDHQFAFCSQIQHGAEIAVTDMTGETFTYTVGRIDRAKHADAQWLTAGEYDLTLFCRDTLTMEYIAVRCSFAFEG
jgi:sortase A